jgi:hypothetical protein
MSRLFSHITLKALSLFIKVFFAIPFHKLYLAFWVIFFNSRLLFSNLFARDVAIEDLFHIIGHILFIFHSF